MVEDGHEPMVLSEFQGGTERTEAASRRLAAARIVTAVGNWVQNVKGSQVSSKHESNYRDETIVTSQSPSSPTEPWANFSATRERTPSHGASFVNTASPSDARFSNSTLGAAPSVNFTPRVIAPGSSL